MHPTSLDVRAFADHVARRPVRCPCCGHGGDKLRLNRIALLADAGPGAHLGATALPLEEQATPIAVVTCTDCHTAQLFAWLPIMDAFNRALAQSLAELEALASPPASTDATTS